MSCFKGPVIWRRRREEVLHRTLLKGRGIKGKDGGREKEKHQRKISWGIIKGVAGTCRTVAAAVHSAEMVALSQPLGGNDGNIEEVQGVQSVTLDTEVKPEEHTLLGTTCYIILSLLYQILEQHFMQRDSVLVGEGEARMRMGEEIKHHSRAEKKILGYLVDMS